MEVLNSFLESEEVLKKSSLVMIVAKAKACSTCSMIIPHLEKNVKHLDRFEQYQIFVDDVEEFRGKHVIFSVPTVLIFEDGKEILRESRFINIGKVNRLLDAYFSA